MIPEHSGDLLNWIWNYLFLSPLVCVFQMARTLFFLTLPHVFWDFSRKSVKNRGHSRSSIMIHILDRIKLPTSPFVRFSYLYAWSSFGFSCSTNSSRQYLNLISSPFLAICFKFTITRQFFLISHRMKLALR